MKPLKYVSVVTNSLKYYNIIDHNPNEEVEEALHKCYPSYVLAPTHTYIQ